MENHIKRLLVEDEVVHHKNGNRTDNSIENLELLSRSEHTKRHMEVKNRALVELKCPNCNKHFIREKRKTFLKTSYRKHKYQCCSNICGGLFQFYSTEKEKKEAEKQAIVREFRGR